MRVSELAVHDQPANRITQTGASTLTTVDLVSLLIGQKDLDRCARMLATTNGSLRQLATRGATELNATPREWKIIQAFSELARRWCAEERPLGRPIQAPRDIVQYCAPFMEDLPVEEFHVLILDAQHRMERDITVTRGILNSSLVHPREVFAEAIKSRAAAIILVHNHPSGDPAPSVDDRAVTDQLAAAGRVLDIPVHDHVIIGRGRYTSFAEAGLL